ncbi:malonyl-ACP O-methyltransferase BioC [Flexithrix dorotheae]|uniref:malonyl-ACP O-methyltransferase BioC n=1 Tax=Flexithrix dorotheae TaxID=70993 RepID=UPI0003A03FD3|nr:malonyl-ACP O-methyltransferase BioC [Flexithrix dorotheae]
MIEKEIVKKRFRKSAGTYHQKAKIQQEVVKKLADIFSRIYPSSTISRLLEIGCGTGFLTQKILSNFNVNQFFINDLVNPENILEAQIKNQLSSKRVNYCSGDAESIILPTNLGAIVSASCFQWFNDLESFFHKISPLINKNGLLAFSTYGPENFREIKSILGTGLDYHSRETISHLLKSDFEILHEEDWLDLLKFQTPIKVLKHIKSTGVNGISHEFLGKEKLQNFISAYLNLYTNQDDSVSLTYHPIIVIARKK